MAVVKFLAAGLVLSSVPPRVLSQEMILPQSRIVVAAGGPLTPIQFQSIVSSQLTQFLQSPPDAGLTRLRALSELPPSPEQVSAETILAIMASASAAEHFSLRQKVGADNTATIEAAGRHLESIAAKDGRLERLMRGLREQFLGGHGSNGEDIERSLKRFFEGISPREEGLSREAIGALRAAAQDDYTIAVLGKEVEGASRLVVLMGEAHIKGQKSSQVGASVLKHFNYRGVEGMDRHATAERRIFFTLIRPIVKLTQWVGLRGSTIHEAQSRDAVGQALANEIRNMSSQQRRALEVRVDEFSGNLDASINERFFPAVSWRHVRRILDSMKTESPAAMPSLEKDIVVFELEQGHQPGFGERLGLLIPPFIFGAMGAAGVWVLLFPPSQMPNIMICAVALSSFLTIYMVLRALLGIDFENSRWFGIFFPWDFGLINSRNRTMVSNIKKSIDDHPEIEKLLVLIGKGHAPGMKKLLLEQHGFKEIPLKSLEKSRS